MEHTTDGWNRCSHQCLLLALVLKGSLKLWLSLLLWLLWSIIKVLTSYELLEISQLMHWSPWWPRLGRSTWQRRLGQVVCEHLHLLLHGSLSHLCWKWHSIFQIQIGQKGLNLILEVRIQILYRKTAIFRLIWLNNLRIILLLSIWFIFVTWLQRYPLATFDKFVSTIIMNLGNRLSFPTNVKLLSFCYGFLIIFNLNQVIILLY